MTRDVQAQWNGARTASSAADVRGCGECSIWPQSPPCGTTRIMGRKYRELRERGKPPKVALTAIMRKMIVLAPAR